MLVQAQVPAPTRICFRRYSPKNYQAYSKRVLVTFLQDSFRISERRACAVLIFRRSSNRYHGSADGQAELRMRIREIATVRVRYGYRRIHVLLLREGWKVNQKRVYRIYCEEGLNLRRKRPKKRTSEHFRVSRETVKNVNDCWSMDFASDSLFNGRRFRALTVVDIFSRECWGLRLIRALRETMW